MDDHTTWFRDFDDFANLAVTSRCHIGTCATDEAFQPESYTGAVLWRPVFGPWLPQVSTSVEGKELAVVAATATCLQGAAVETDRESPNRSRAAFIMLGLRSQASHLLRATGRSGCDGKMALSMRQHALREGGGGRPTASQPCLGKETSCSRPLQSRHAADFSDCLREYM